MQFFARKSLFDKSHQVVERSSFHFEKDVDNEFTKIEQTGIGEVYDETLLNHCFMCVLLLRLTPIKSSVLLCTAQALQYMITMVSVGRGADPHGSLYEFLLGVS